MGSNYFFVLTRYKTFKKQFFMRIGVLKTLLILLVTSFELYSYAHHGHENMSEDALGYMESKGSIQQRWVVDYLKAKIGGRYSSNAECGLIPYHSQNTPREAKGGIEDQRQCGVYGIFRVGNTLPDYFRDFFWTGSLLVSFDWNIPSFSILSNNLSSGQHFINLLTKNDNGDPLTTNIYNDYDGFSVKNAYGNGIFGNDYLIWGLTVAKAQLVIDLPECKRLALEGVEEYANCSEAYSSYVNGNPAIDFKQNGSRTPVSTDRIIENAPLTNYNCAYDNLVLFGACRQDKNAGTTPNVYEQEKDGLSGALSQLGDALKTGQDWAIFEPADNLATFYYMQLFLEGDQTRNGTLEEESIVGRYYTVTHRDLLHLGTSLHWATDLNQPTHVWATIGSNHAPYEGYVENNYGKRVMGGGASYNIENYEDISAHRTQRRNNYRTLRVGDIQTMFMEQAFMTYHLLFRDGYNKLRNGNDQIYSRIALWGINNAILINSNIIEKGILDIRKCRQSSSCNN